MSLLTLHNPNYHPEALEFEFICRICLKRGQLQSIFKYRDKYKPLEMIDLSTKVRLCSSINMDINDGLPSNICEKCVNLLYISHHFRLLSENNDRKLRNILIKAKENGYSVEKFNLDNSNFEFTTENLSFARKNKTNIKTEHEPWEFVVVDENFMDLNFKNEIFDHADTFSNTDSKISSKITDFDCIDNFEDAYFESMDEISTDETNRTKKTKTRNIFKQSQTIDDNIISMDETNERCSRMIKKDNSNKGSTEDEDLSKDDDNSLDVPLQYFVSKKLDEESKKVDESNMSLKSVLNKESRFKLMKGDLSCYGCLLCGKQFYRKSTLDRHMLVEHGDSERNKDYKCYACEEIFKTRYSRLQHEKNDCPNMPPGTKYQCRKCERRFDERTDLDAHLRVHRGGTQPPPARTLELEPLHKCPHCAYTSRSRPCVKAHVRSKHSSERPYVCEICGKGFSTSATLYTHRVVHSDVKKHKCSYCPYSSKLRSALVVHERRHTNEFPYTCDVCGRHWTSSSTLVRHRRTHDALKEYQCQLCDKRFGLKPSLTHHISSFHMGLKPHICSMCDCAYARKRELRRHMKRCHGVVNSTDQVQTADNNYVEESNQDNSGVPQGSHLGPMEEIVDYDTSRVMHNSYGFSRGVARKVIKSDDGEIAENDNYRRNLTLKRGRI